MTNAAPETGALASSRFRDILRGRERPTLSPTDARARLEEAWSHITGRSPDKRTTDILTAHWALETDAGRAMPGNNFAGIKALGSAVGNAYRTREGYGAHERQIVARFRSYDSPEAGARDYVRLLATRYPAALDAARRGDADAFTRELARGGYFTADPHLYARGLALRLTEIEHGSEAGGGCSPAPTASGALLGVLQAFQRAADDRDEA